MNRNLVITSVFGFLAVVLGAFGAHALKEKLGVDDLKSFETAVRYQMYHVLVLLIVNLNAAFSQKTRNRISYLLFTGIIFFSGSIYAITVANVPAKYIWFITPLGGLFFVLGWLKMGISFLKKG